MGLSISHGPTKADSCTSLKNCAVAEMAEGPLYVNVKHKEQKKKDQKKKERRGKQSKPHYKNVSILPSEEGDLEGYQIVHERGLDPNGEYTDLTRTANPEQTDKATLQREKMINDLLFPPEKNAPKRFNYTDIQLPPVTNEDEGVPSSDLSGHSPAHTQDELRSTRKPMTKPKPKMLGREASIDGKNDISVSFEEEEEATPYEVAEEEDAAPYEVAMVEEADEPGRKCSWDAHGSKVVYAVLLAVCVCVSLAAVTVATVAIVKLSSVCEQTYLYEECEITARVEDWSSLLVGNCTTPSIEVMGVSGWELV